MLHVPHSISAGIVKISIPVYVVSMKIELNKCKKRQKNVSVSIGMEGLKSTQTRVSRDHNRQDACIPTHFFIETLLLENKSQT